MRRYLTAEQYMAFASAVAEHRGARCLVTLVLADRKPLVSSALLSCRVPYDAAHLIPQRALAEHVPAEKLLTALTDVRNGVIACRRHHNMLDGCAIALEPDEWPVDAWEFAADYGLVWWIEKRLERRAAVERKVAT